MDSRQPELPATSALLYAVKYDFANEVLRNALGTEIMIENVVSSFKCITSTSKALTNHEYLF